MATKFRINVWREEAKIEEIEILRETDKCVFLPAAVTKHNPKGEERVKKMTGCFQEYHDTWEEAHASLTRKANNNVAAARSTLERVNAFADNVKCMKKP